MAPAPELQVPPDMDDDLDPEIVEYNLCSDLIAGSIPEERVAEVTQDLLASSNVMMLSQLARFPGLSSEQQSDLAQRCGDLCEEDPRGGALVAGALSRNPSLTTNAAAALWLAVDIEQIRNELAQRRDIPEWLEAMEVLAGNEMMY